MHEHRNVIATDRAPRVTENSRQRVAPLVKGTHLDQSLDNDITLYNRLVAPVQQCPGCLRPAALKDHGTGRNLCYCAPELPSVAAGDHERPASTRVAPHTVTVAHTDPVALREALVMRHALATEAKPAGLRQTYLASLERTLRREVTELLGIS